MKIDNVIFNTVTDEGFIYSNGNEYYFESRSAYMLFLLINSKDTTATAEEVFEKHIIVCFVQEEFFNRKKSWDGFTNKSNEIIVDYLFNNWSISKNEDPKQIADKLL